MKKIYMKPTTQVVKIQQTSIICQSPAAKSLQSADNFSLKEDGFIDDDEDF